MENPALFVRVSIPQGHFTVPTAVAESEGWTVLKQDALDKNGAPIPPEYHDASTTQDEADGPTAPSRSAKRDEWETFARSVGLVDDQIAALNKVDLIETTTSPGLLAAALATQTIHPTDSETDVSDDTSEESS